MHAHVLHPACTIRSAEPNDQRAIEMLLKAAQLRSDNIAPYLADFFVAEDAGNIVGAIGLECHGEYGMLRSLVVQRSQRGRGIGGALTLRLLETAEARELRAIFLLATTAVTFFPRFGFVDIPREQVPEEVQSSRDFVDTTPASAVVMRRLLAR